MAEVLTLVFMELTGIQEVFVLHFDLIFVFSVVPDAPKIDRTAAELTRIHLKWSAPSQANGLLQDYKVCFNLKGGSPTCINTPNQQYGIDNLNPGTTYNISVSASTVAGNGPIDWKLIETTKSGK